MNITNDEYFCFLDYLREEGQTNMFGAASYLEEEFDIPHEEARQVLSAWMQGTNGQPGSAVRVDCSSSWDETGQEKLT